MKTFQTLLTIATLLAILSGAGLAQEGKSYAVLVGVEKYKHPSLTPLQYAIEDVTEFGDLLTKSGYKVTLLTDDAKEKEHEPTRINIETALKSVLRKCEKRDTVIVAFAGHGLQFAGQKDAYFCPVDARPFADETDSLVSIAKVYAELQKSFAGSKVVFIDACRNDPDPGRGRGLDADSAPPPPAGVAAMFSCKAGQRAFEHDTIKHGVFFHHVLKGFRGEAASRKGEVTLLGMAQYLNDSVPETISTLLPEQKQTPNLKADTSGKLLLTRITTNPDKPLLSDSPMPDKPALSDTMPLEQGKPVKLGAVIVEAPQTKPFSGSLDGTHWKGTDSQKDQYDFYFLPDGELYYDTGLGLRPNGTWTAKGNSIAITVNDGFATLTAQLTGRTMMGTGSSRDGSRWSWSAQAQ